MPTVITHAAVPLFLGAGLGLKVIPPRLQFAGVELEIITDQDVLDIKYGVEYGKEIG
ncbi:metal-dependent hydrolase, partial [Salmonella enterica subsp. enterica serovar Infantis]